MERFREMTQPGAAFRWKEKDTRAYLRYIEMVRTVRERQKWKLDVSWLLSQGVAIPPKLQRYSLPLNRPSE